MLGFLKNIDPKQALVQLAGVDFAPIVRDQFDKLAEHLATEQQVPVEQVSIIYFDSHLGYAINGEFKAILNDEQVLAILKPTGILAFVKTQLVEIVKSQLSALVEHFSDKCENAQLLTQHPPVGSDIKSLLWVAGIDKNTQESFLYQLPDFEIKEILTPNFRIND